MVEVEETKPKQPKKISGTDVFLILFLALIVVVHILAWKNPDFGEKFSMENLFSGDYLNTSIWLALGLTMVACFLGALIPMPVPYMIPVATFSFVWAEETPAKWGAIILLILTAALANTLGDMLDYIIGRGTEKVIQRDDPELSNKWAQIVMYKPKLIPWVIVLFAVTPLPDSLLLVPLGFVKYPAKRTMFSMFIGKIAMMLITSLAGIFGISAILDLVGGEGSWVSGIILLYFMWVLIAAMVKIKIPEKKPASDSIEPPTSAKE